MAIPITPAMSLNRVRIVDLPGLEIPPEIKGKTAYELVSASYLAQLIRAPHPGAALGIDAGLGDHALRLAFDRCLGSEDAAVQTAAREIAWILGRNLGYILLALRRGDAINRQARHEWDFRHWEHWAGIRQVWLGGGMVSGNLGRTVPQDAAAVLRAGGIVDYRIQVSPYAAQLPLLGAARHLPEDVAAAVALDFGGTRIKRAWVTLEEGRLVAFQRMPSLPVTWRVAQAMTETTREQAEQLVQGMAAIIAATWRAGQAQGVPLAAAIPVSLAAYVKDGSPLLTQGGVYMQTRLITDNLAATLAQRVSAALGRAVHITLLHDGTAAAAVYAGAENAAVITWGTALGIGFPGDAANLRPIAKSL